MQICYVLYGLNMQTHVVYFSQLQPYWHIVKFENQEVCYVVHRLNTDVNVNTRWDREIFHAYTEWWWQARPQEHMLK